MIYLSNAGAKPWIDEPFCGILHVQIITAVLLKIQKNTICGATNSSTVPAFCMYFLQYLL
jgi:hypothetical protein